MNSGNVLTPYEKVLAARKSDRPDIMKYIEVLFDDFIEMHGDRYYKDDKSLVAGIASFNGKTVTVIGNRNPCAGHWAAEHSRGCLSLRLLKLNFQTMKKIQIFQIICIQ